MKEVKEIKLSTVQEIQTQYQEAVVNLISNERYVDLSFYGFILSKLNVQYKPTFPTLGVSFNEDAINYNLIIGSYFTTLTLEEKIAVLIHETRHILGLHTVRKGDREHELFNIAADISINQIIKNLPEGAQYPETYDFPKNESAETYYELLKQEKEQQEKDKQEAEESGEEFSPGTNSQGNTKPDLTEGEEQTLDVHDWQNCEGTGTEELQKSIAENMTKEAISQAKGNLPGDIENILNLLKKKPKISWKKELRKILSSRNGTRIETRKRKNRRFPHRADLRGRKVQKDKPIVVVGVDTSGSMDDSDVLNGLVEINDVIKNIGELKIIQIDASIRGSEIFNKNKFKRFKRKGYGGTYMGACPKYIKEAKEKCDVLIMISDMYIEDIPTDENWKSFKKPVLWLSTSGQIPEILKHHKIFNIENK